MDGVLSQEEINALLNEPGAEASDSAENELSDAQKDAIGEIANISMGTAATAKTSMARTATAALHLKEAFLWCMSCFGLYVYASSIMSSLISPIASDNFSDFLITLHPPSPVSFSAFCADASVLRTHCFLSSQTFPQSVRQTPHTSTV